MSSVNDSSLFSMTGLTNVPIFCFPEIIEKLPISLTYCFIYLLGSTGAIALGFYLYYKRMLREKLWINISTGNEYFNDKQNPEEQSSNKKILRGMLRRGQDSVTGNFKVTSIDGDK